MTLEWTDLRMFWWWQVKEHIKDMV